MASKGPSKLTIRSYQVGFGDCFLLTFHYPKADRHVLVDFGSTKLPPGAPKDQLQRIAADIKTRTNSKLDAIVVTHRHKDHLSGFATTKQGKGPGDVIASCRPTLIVQPWTEDPKAQPDAKRATKTLSATKAFVASLHGAEIVARYATEYTRRSRAGLSPALREELSFLGETNLSNALAVKNLMRMGTRHAYVHFGSKSGLERLLPGVRVDVLGPPTLEQTETIRKQTAVEKDEFWHLAATARRSSRQNGQLLFRQFHANGFPPNARWIRHRLRTVRARNLLELVRILDNVLNNTSVILLIRVGRHAVLFPGDAQIENWAYALAKSSVRKQLEPVTVYKVGHHGSLNATPKTMWNLLRHRGDAKRKRRLQSLLSTLEDVHGSEDRKTEVPRRTLVSALQKETGLFTTQKMRNSELSRAFEFPLR